MSTPALDAIEAEIQANYDILLPKLRGLKDMVNDPFSSEAQRILQQQIAILDQHRVFYEQALGGVQQLKNMGYPLILSVTVPADVMAEFTREHCDVRAAVSIFQEESRAVGGTVTFPDPTPKP